MLLSPAAALVMSAALKSISSIRITDPFTPVIFSAAFGSGDVTTPRALAT
jgi:hypothetical protein